VPHCEEARQLLLVLLKQRSHRVCLTTKQGASDAAKERIKNQHTPEQEKKID
jgi:hypothetical protein